MNETKQRVMIEEHELNARIKKLWAFIDGETFKSLDANDKDLLSQQHQAMTQYSNILHMRILCWKDDSAVVCTLHPGAGVIVRSKGPHIGVYCKQCGKCLKWICANDVDDYIKPDIDEDSIEQHDADVMPIQKNAKTDIFDTDNDLPWH